MKRKVRNQYDCESYNELIRGTGDFSRMNRRRKLYLNTITALLNQLVALICGFILPRYILTYFGSDTNGLVNSITQFLSAISFLELGIGPVIQSNLYKPLAENDTITISKIVVSAERFYRRIAYIFLVYIAVLAIVFPSITPEYDFWYTASLLLIISISTFAQYYFGITYQVFLNADQKVYVHSTVQIVTVILNTVLSVILMQLGCGIHIVKLVSAIVFVLRPVVQNVYVKKNYCIDRKITYTEEPIKQKWNGFAQHLAAVVCDQTDVALLTFFSTYQKVSIYSIYLLVVNGITKLFMTAASGWEAFLGNMLARKEYAHINKTFGCIEAVVHAGVTFLFTTTAILIAPFVMVYTKGVEDSVAYYLPLFGAILAFAYGVRCLRTPYFIVIKAAGHYKETQNGAFISMAINILLSVILVFKYQLVGVAIGTLLAMLYHTAYFAWYLRKNIVNRPFYHFIKHFLLDIVDIALGFLSTIWLSMRAYSYVGWFIYAIAVAVIVGAITLVLNMILYKAEFEYLVKKVLKKI